MAYTSILFSLTVNWKKCKLMTNLFLLQVIPVLQQVPQMIQGVSADQMQAQLEDPFKNKKKTQPTRRR